MSESENNRETLTKGGLKSTRARQLILDALRSAAAPVTAEQIHRQLPAEPNPVWLSTVYRTLDALTVKGIATRSIRASDGQAAYELSQGGHRHRLICTGCQKTVNIEGCPLAAFEASLGKQTDFTVQGHRLELYGLCSVCREKGSSR